MNKSAPLIKKEITDGLVSRWQFGEGTGTTVSDSWGSNDGTSSGGMTWETGKVGAFSGGFDGFDDYVNIPGITDNPTNITQMLWVKTIASGSSITLMTKRQVENGSDWPTIMLSSSKTPQIAVDDSAYYNTIIGTTDVNDGEWHHVAGVKDGTTYKIYVDGVEENSEVDAHSMSGSSSDMRLGNGIVTGNYFDGEMDDVRIYNRALSASEIAVLYNKYR